MIIDKREDLSAPATWKMYLYASAKFLFFFYISTLCMILFFTHRGEDWLTQGIFLIGLYLFVLVVSLRQMIKQLPLAAIFLAAPIIPLCMLFLLISMIPLL